MVSGARPERWIRQTNFDNDEAVGYLADRLARLGVEEELLRLGARAGLRGDHRGHDVRLGAANACRTTGCDECPMSGRGTDARLERTERVGAAERKSARRQRRERNEES